VEGQVAFCLASNAKNSITDILAFDFRERCWAQVNFGTTVIAGASLCMIKKLEVEGMMVNLNAILASPMESEVSVVISTDAIAIVRSTILAPKTAL
jgi:hypothetical protein